MIKQFALQMKNKKQKNKTDADSWISLLISEIRTVARVWFSAFSRLPRQFLRAPKFEKQSRKKRKKVCVGLQEGRGKESRR